MTPLPIPQEVIYAGLAGSLLALIVATAQQKWQPKVFFLLALRLAIGWQFLFEGLYKIQSYTVGPTETNRVFTSEPYFKASPTFMGAEMRKKFDDPQTVFERYLKPNREITPEAFRALNLTEQAGACPAGASEELEKLLDKAEAAELAAVKKQLDALTASEEKALKAAKTDAEKAAIKAKNDKTRADLDARSKAAKTSAASDVLEAKAKFARWVYGVDGRDTKVKFHSSDAALTLPQRFEHLKWLKKENEEADARRRMQLGNGPTEIKRAAEVRTEVFTAESELAKDALSFLDDLKSGLNGGKALEETRPESMGKKIDRFTMWFIAVVGACILLGLFTKVSCVLAAGFLLMTYLAFPPLPWFPVPPNTEGNPLFINKNAIEFFALLALAFMPTGRWLGLDALLFGDVREK